MKTKIKKAKNPKHQIQGLLLMDEMIGKYGELENAEKELKRLNSLFNKNGRKLIASKSGDEVYYLTQHLKAAREILEKI